MKVYGLDEEDTSHWTKPHEMWCSQEFYTSVSWIVKLRTVDGRMLNTSNIILKWCILLCVSTIYEFCFSCQTQQYTKQCAHISLCIIEFISLLMYCLMMDPYMRHNSIVQGLLMYRLMMAPWAETYCDIVNL
jgi:hypothetical protein